MENMQEIILTAIKTDDSFTEKNNRVLIDLYKNSSKLDKNLIDKIFIELCGYSFNSLIGNN